MAMRLVLASMVAVIASPLSAQSENWAMETGNHVLTTCQSREVIEQDLCLGWVIGVTQGIMATTHLSGEMAVCLPKGSNNRQYLDVILSYLDANPEKRHLLSGITAYLALSEAFPCKNSN